MITYSDHDIVSIYGAEYRNIVQYYLLTGDVRRLHRLRWVRLTSMLKTLTSKHRSTATKIAAKHKAKIVTPYGPRTCFEVTSNAEEAATSTHRLPSSRADQPALHDTV